MTRKLGVSGGRFSSIKLAEAIRDLENYSTEVREVAASSLYSNKYKSNDSKLKAIKKDLKDYVSGLRDAGRLHEIGEVGDLLKTISGEFNNARGYAAFRKAGNQRDVEKWIARTQRRADLYNRLSRKHEEKIVGDFSLEETYLTPTSDLTTNPELVPGGFPGFVRSRRRSPQANYEEPVVASSQKEVNLDEVNNIGPGELIASLNEKIKKGGSFGRKSNMFAPHNLEISDHTLLVKPFGWLVRSGKRLLGIHSTKRRSRLGRLGEKLDVNKNDYNQSFEPTDFDPEKLGPGNLIAVVRGVSRTHITNGSIPLGRSMDYVDISDNTTVLPVVRKAGEMLDSLGDRLADPLTAKKSLLWLATAFTSIGMSSYSPFPGMFGYALQPKSEEASQVQSSQFSLSAEQFSDMFSGDLESKTLDLESTSPLDLEFVSSDHNFNIQGMTSKFAGVSNQFVKSFTDYFGKGKEMTQDGLERAIETQNGVKQVARNTVNEIGRRLTQSISYGIDPGLTEFQKKSEINYELLNSQFLGNPEFVDAILTKPKLQDSKSNSNVKSNGSFPSNLEEIEKFQRNFARELELLETQKPAEIVQTVESNKPAQKDLGNNFYVVSNGNGGTKTVEYNRGKKQEYYLGAGDERGVRAFEKIVTKKDSKKH